jgi:hypothetical protein
MAVYHAYNEVLTNADVSKATGRLQPSSTVTTVRVVNGKSQELDRPFADSKERLVGHYMALCADMTTVTFES